MSVMSVHQTSRRSPREELARLAEALGRYPSAGEDQSAATTLLEQAVTQVLGKPAAVLMPTGKMAQQIALRIHADRRPGRRVFLAHPTNHLTLWEDENYSWLHSLHARLAGDRHELMTVGDMRATLGEDVAVVMWELPQRELGGELPPWCDLEAQLGEAKKCGAATHLDGARLWQTWPFYGRSLAEICAGFDSVYVSLYKDLEAPRGAVLAGDDDFIRAARSWRHRLGGTIDEAWPLALLALDGLERAVDRMPDYVTHARAAAEAITRQTTATVRPDPPHAAMFHIHLPVAAQAAHRAQEQLIAEGGPRLSLRIRTNPEPLRCSLEVTVGEAALAFDPEQIAEAVERLIELARSLAVPTNHQELSS